MSSSFSLANGVALASALIGWAALGVAFVRGSRGGVRGKAGRDGRSLAGLAVQMAGATLVWSVRRGPATPLVGDPGSPFEVVVPLLAAALVVAAVWLSWGAFRALGAQWSLEARVLSDHQLVTIGPYKYVRHPIYAAVWALLLATGLALSRWPALAAGAALYGAGTLLRIRSEEALLRGRLHEAYDVYAARIPALVPRPWAR
ncbi:MAG: isoprenylcysteine carboxylmethyltransferase family protein [Acidobacteriota bacterium]